MDRATRQAQLRQKLQQLKQQQAHQFAQQTVEQLAIPVDHCTWLLPTDQLAIDCIAWLRRAFPWQWSQIDWTEVPNSICLRHKKDLQLVAVFNQLCKQTQLGNPIVMVVWFNARNPVLKMDLATAQQHALSLFTHDWDTWIVQPEAGWCIEYHHEGTLCFGFGAVDDGTAA